MKIIIDVQEQFWDFFSDFKKEYNQLKPFITKLFVINNKTVIVTNKNQLNRIRPGFDFPNANMLVPLYDILQEPNPEKIIVCTGNLFSPIGFIDLKVLKQDYVKAEVPINCNFLGNDVEVKEFLHDITVFTQVKMFKKKKVSEIFKEGIK